MIFVDTNVLYSVLVKTKFSKSAQDIILMLPINDNLDDWNNAMIRYNLMPNDAMIASTCLKHEISKIATFDSDFLRVDWLSVIDQIK